LASPYYNLFELATAKGAREIVRMGHRIGLHFDPQSHIALHEGVALETFAMRERVILSEIVDGPVDAVSFHNPAFSGALSLDADLFAGMHNAYGARLHSSYMYCSDSFGYWRFRPIQDVLSEREATRLHILTHPAWWTEVPMGTRARIRTIAEARA